MSATFFNMRRRIAAAQKAEQASKPVQAKEPEAKEKRTDKPKKGKVKQDA